ncbi:MAG: hypothetical protein ABIJ12_03190 [bacterium]
MMEDKIYKPNHTIALLCEHKQQYQNNILFAWLIVFLITGITCLFLMKKNDSLHNINDDRFILSSINSTAGVASMEYPSSCGPPGAAFIKSTNSYFPSGGKVKYTIIKERSSSIAITDDTPLPDINTGIELEGIMDPFTFVPAFSYNEDDQFGLPVDSSLIDFYSISSRYNTPEFCSIKMEDRSSSARIDWVYPRWPKRGEGLDAVVVARVSVSNNGKKICHIIKEEPSDLDFGKELVKAINESIFWPAKDIYGRQLDASYLITYNYCRDCKENTFEIVSGDVVIKSRSEL